jgi:hypothetical protein
VISKLSSGKNARPDEDTAERQQNMLHPSISNNTQLQKGTGEQRRYHNCDRSAPPVNVLSGTSRSSLNPVHFGGSVTGGGAA